jgi:hypothetical protein
VHSRWGQKGRATLAKKSKPKDHEAVVPQKPRRKETTPEPPEMRERPPSVRASIVRRWGNLFGRNREE